MRKPPAVGAAGELSREPVSWVLFDVGERAEARHDDGAGRRGHRPERAGAHWALSKHRYMGKKKISRRLGVVVPPSLGVLCFVSLS